MLADPHHFDVDPDADPDPAFHSDADLDPTFHFDADRTRIQIPKMIRIHADPNLHH